MPHRNLRDDDGQDWEIWDVIPSAVAQSLDDEHARHSHDAHHEPAQFSLPAELRDGWLAFQSSAESRRLAPIPVDWVDLSDAQLTLLIARAEPVPIRAN
jgi:hypothetical protein